MCRFRSIIKVSKGQRQDSMMQYFSEVGEDTCPAPARISKSLPGIVVVRTATVPAHSIQNASATEDFALRHRTRGAIELDLRYSGEIPVVNTSDVGSDVDRILNDGFVVIGLAGFDAENSPNANPKSVVYSMMA